MADPNPYNNFRSGSGSSGRNQQKNLELFFADLETLGITVDQKTPEKALDIIRRMPDSFSNEINKTYKKLAFKLHPDKNPGDESAEKKFKIVNEAFGNLQALNNSFKTEFGSVINDKSGNLSSCITNLSSINKIKLPPQRQPQPPSPPFATPAPKPKPSKPVESEQIYESFLNNNKDQLDSSFSYFKTNYDLLFDTIPGGSQKINNTKLRHEFDRRVKEFVTTPIEPSQIFTWKPKNANDPLDFSFNIISTSADNGGNFLRTEREKFFAVNPIQEQSSQTNTQKEKEQSIEEKWSSLIEPLLKLKEDASSNITVASSQIDSSLKYASSVVCGFSTNLTESTRTRVDSLAITISTSVTTTLSTALNLFALIKPPEINLPPEEIKASHEPQKQEPKTSFAEKTLGQKIREKLEEVGKGDRVKKAIETAKASSLRAKEEVKKATPANMQRASSASSMTTPAKTHSPSAPLQIPPKTQGPKVAFFGQGAKAHAANPKRKRKIENPKPAPNGPRKSTASSLNPQPPEKPRI